MWFKTKRSDPRGRVWVDMTNPEVTVPEHEMFTVQEAARAWRVKPQLVYKMLNEGVLACFRMKGHESVIRIPRSEILKMGMFFRQRLVNADFFRDLGDE